MEDQLQFQKAEFHDSARQCVLCQISISGSYYHYAGKVVCANCATQRPELQHSSGASYFGKAILYGLGAATAGSVVYAIVGMTTGMHFSLIAILVGFMVGKAIKTATLGRGGLKYQVLAVFLTYGAITTGYLPELIQGARQAAKKKGAVQPPADAPPPTAAKFVLGVTILIGVALAFPILYILHSPGGGLLNALILVFGLLQAWRLTRGDNVVLMGPYSAEPSSS